MEYTEFVANNSYSLVWLIFGLSVSVGLAIDLVILDVVRKYLDKKMARSNKTSKNKLSNKQEETESLNKLNSDLQGQQDLKTFRRNLYWTIIWISLAGTYAIILYIALGQETAVLFITGYALEKSLSVDNMFVFLLIFSSLSIPYSSQHKVLMIGILSAIVMRIGLILAGVSLLESFHWMLYVFGGLLLFTGIRMLIQKREKKIEIEKNLAVRILRKFIPVSLEPNVDVFLLRKNGILFASPLLVALVIVEMTDLIFALDSIPAILAITRDPLVVITSNVFAILGLRSLYFLLAGLMDKIYYLKSGLAAILLFIGIKMIVSELYDIPINVSLIAIFCILMISITLSFVRTRIGFRTYRKF